MDARQAELAANIVSERIPVTDEKASGAARLFNVSGRRRGTLVRCMIAATALHAGAVVATANPSDFRQFEVEGSMLAVV